LEISNYFPLKDLATLKTLAEQLNIIFPKLETDASYVQLFQSVANKTLLIALHSV
jgi:hypothetical protein